MHHFFFNTRLWLSLESRLIGVLLILLLPISNNTASQERLLYRYINENGVKVLTYSIPAQYTAKGYEIVDSSGRLIKAVPPELSPEDRAKAEAARAEKERLEILDSQLLKRYSRVSDIEAAKKRKLAEISANINILEGNMVNFNEKKDKLLSQAATMERNGQPIPDAILVNIDAIKEELAAITGKIKLRKEEYEEQTDKFDKEIARFMIIMPANQLNGEEK